MPNLTFDQNLIRPHKPEPLEGHNVVVLERVGAEGEKFHSVLESGGDPPSPGLLAWLLNRTNVYFAFAVDASQGRPLDWEESVQMSERAHGFVLQFTLWYRVADAQRLVAAREQDPLERVRRKASELITEEIAELRWAEVWHSFRPAGERVVSSVLHDLKTFAKDYGLAIASVKLKPKFSEDAARYDRDAYDARQQGELLKTRMAVADDVKTHRWDLRRNAADRDRDEQDAARRAKLEDTVFEKYGDFLRGATSVDDLAYVARSLPVGSSGALPGAPQPAALPPSNGHVVQSLPAGAAGDALPEVLSDLLTLTGQLNIDVQRRQVQAALLHLVAAVVAQDSPQVTPEQNGYSRQAQTALATATHLPPDYLERLRELADPKALRPRLHAPMHP